MHNQKCKERLYRETGHSILSQEREDCGAVTTRHGVIISATSTGKRMAIDMFATTEVCLKSDAED